MKLSNNSTPAQSIDIVDPEGSYKKDNQGPVYSLGEIFEFYQNSHIVGQRILRLILSDKTQYIKLKQIDHSWSELTFHMAEFNNQALRMASIMKYSFLNRRCE